MNAVKKIYCRTFQFVMRVALPFLPYREPKLLDGVDGVDGVAALLTKKKIGRVLLVTDKGIRSHHLTEPLEKALAGAGIGVSIFDETVANPTVANVEAARRMYLDDGCGAIIAFGGGSSMDCAKAAGARIARPEKAPLPHGGPAARHAPAAPAHCGAHHRRHRQRDHPGRRHHGQRDPTTNTPSTTLP